MNKTFLRLISFTVIAAAAPTAAYAQQTINVGATPASYSGICGNSQSSNGGCNSAGNLGVAGAVSNTTSPTSGNTLNLTGTNMNTNGYEVYGGWSRVAIRSFFYQLQHGQRNERYSNQRFRRIDDRMRCSNKLRRKRCSDC